MDLAKRKLRPFFVVTRRQKRNIRICLGTVLMALAFYEIFYRKQDEQSRVDFTSSETFQEKQRKLILVYTPNPSEPWILANGHTAKPQPWRQAL